MERPWSTVIWWWYSYKLEEQFPMEVKNLGLEHLPAAWTWLGGFGWNYRWYASLVKKVRLPDPDEFTQVREAQPLPASCNYIDTSDVDSVRRIHAGLRALEENVPKTRAYHELDIAEFKCLQLCQSANRSMGQQGIEETCEKGCLQGRIQAMVDLKAEIRKWKESAVACMRKHSITTGDGNHAEFDQCLATFANEAVSHGTNGEALNTWISQYKKNEPASETIDIRAVINRPA